MRDERVIFIPLRCARLCCEVSCEAIFATIGIVDSSRIRCPACGGASWIPLTKIVEPVEPRAPAAGRAPPRGRP